VATQMIEETTFDPTDKRKLIKTYTNETSLTGGYNWI